MGKTSSKSPFSSIFHFYVRLPEYIGCHAPITLPSQSSTLQKTSSQLPRRKRGLSCHESHSLWVQQKNSIMEYVGICLKNISLSLSLAPYPVVFSNGFMANVTYVSFWECNIILRVAYGCRSCLRFFVFQSSISGINRFWTIISRPLTKSKHQLKLNIKLQNQLLSCVARVLEGKLPALACCKMILRWHKSTRALQPSKQEPHAWWESHHLLPPSYLVCLSNLNRACYTFPYH